MKFSSFQGFVLTELLIAGLLTSFLMLGIIQMAAGTSRGLALIESLSETQQAGRFAIDQIRDSLMSAAYRPSPWMFSGQLTTLEAGTRDGGPGGNDTLHVRQYSDRNCYGNANSVHDGKGQPAFFLRESKFELTASNNLAHTCWFGPQDGVMVRQINRQGLVRQVESFQALYAEDSDGDRMANRMVRAGAWNDVNNIVGVSLGLMVATEKPVTDSAPATLTVLDETITPRSDGRLRRVWTTMIPLVSRLR